MAEKHNCRACKHHRRGLDDDEAGSWEHDCFAMPHLANLTSFPFKNTTCPAFDPRPGGIPPVSLNEALSNLKHGEAL